MVRAILAGRKTQTRRIGKLQSPEYAELAVEYSRHATKGREAVATYAAFPGKGTARWGICACPYGVPGDRLWVKETLKRSDDGLWGQYAADGEWVISRPPFAPLRQCWHSRTDKSLSKSNRASVPSIHMPRRASRITLEIETIRAERLQDISEKDAAAEGVEASKTVEMKDGSPCYTLPYQTLWNQINGCDSWDANPWVWVVTFKQVFNDRVKEHLRPET